MADELKTIKFQMMLSPSEAEAIDDWSFKNRIRSRAEAIRRLAQMSLRIDDDIGEIYAKTRRLQEELSTKLELVQQLLSETPVKWEVAGKAGVLVTSDLIKHVTELAISVQALTSQVVKMRGIGDVPDLKREADEIKARSVERAKMLRMLIKAADAGIDLDDEDDE